MAQQGHEMVQGDPNLNQNRPNMTQKWLERCLEIIGKPREKLFNRFAQTAGPEENIRSLGIYLNRQSFPGSHSGNSS
jgi:hypothetical protein